MRTLLLAALLLSVAAAGLAPTASACELDPNADSLWLAYRPSDMHVIGGYEPNVECGPVVMDTPMRIDIGP